MKKIILVEDDEAIRHAFSIALNPYSYKLESYASGEKIIDNTVKAPDLFILDKNIPGPNGLDICRHIKSNNKYKHVPVLMMSAHPQLELLAKQVGADGIISKPFSLDILRAIVAHSIN
jgi:DNA-binding response OmpR family regulator